MAETFSGASFSSSYWIVRPVGYNHDRYRFYLYGKVNSYDLTNKRVNITVKCYCGAMYGGYIDFWSCYDDIHIQNGSTVVNNGATRVYVSTIGRGYSSEATSYVNQCWTHTEAGNSNGETKHADGDFFTWTGNVNYNMNSSNNVGSLSLTMYHTVGGPTNQAYLPVNVDKTLRVTWNIPSIYKVSYNGNGGTAGATENWVVAGNTVTLPTLTRGNTTTTNGYAITTSYNANGGTSTPSAQTSYRSKITSYTPLGWYTAASGGTKVGDPGASYTPSTGLTIYGQWSPSDSAGSSYTSITTAAAIARNNSGNHNGGTGIVTTYSANGGSSTPASQTSYRQYQTKYTFEKWHVGSAAGTTSVGASSTYTPTANNTLYANWTTSEVAQSTYGSITVAGAITRNTSTSTSTITVNFNYGSGSGTTTSLNSTATNVVAYTFNGWHEGSATGTNHTAGSSWAPTANTTLVASWNTSTTSGTYGAITLPSATAPANMAFDGWYTASSGGTLAGQAGASYSPSATTTLYARYFSITVAQPAGHGIYIKTENGWKEIKSFARIKTASTTWKTYVD